jgi:transcriptional regulator with XRE-family HTH domain
MEDIAEQLRLARENAGLTIYQTALALDVPLSYWEELESGKRAIEFAIGVRACLLFGAEPDDIVRPQDGTRPPKIEDAA